MTLEERLIYVEEAVQDLVERIKRLEEDYAFLSIQHTELKDRIFPLAIRLDEDIELDEPLPPDNPDLKDFDDMVADNPRWTEHYPSKKKDVDKKEE